MLCSCMGVSVQVFLVRQVLHAGGELPARILVADGNRGIGNEIAVFLDPPGYFR